MKRSSKTSSYNVKEGNIHVEILIIAKTYGYATAQFELNRRADLVNFFVTVYNKRKRGEE